MKNREVIAAAVEEEGGEPLRQDLAQFVRMERQRENSHRSIATIQYIKHCLKHYKVYILVAAILIGLGAAGVGLQAAKNGDARMRYSLDTVIDLLPLIDSRSLRKLAKAFLGEEDSKKMGKIMKALVVGSGVGNETLETPKLA